MMPRLGAFVGKYLRKVFLVAKAWAGRPLVSQAARGDVLAHGEAPPVIFRLSKAIFGEMLSKALS